jgi:hypothetical protein
MSTSWGCTARNSSFPGEIQTCGRRLYTFVSKEDEEENYVGLTGDDGTKVEVLECKSLVANERRTSARERTEDKSTVSIETR